MFKTLLDISFCHQTWQFDFSLGETATSTSTGGDDLSGCNNAWSINPIIPDVG